MIWASIRPKGFKWHSAPTSLVRAIEADLRAREPGVEIVTVPGGPAVGLDHGGAMIFGRPLESFRLSGYTLDVPSEHLGDFIKVVIQAPPREAFGKAYVKIHCYWNCVVLTPSMRGQFIKLATARSPGAAQRAKAFYDAWRKDMRRNLSADQAPF